MEPDVIMAPCCEAMQDNDAGLQYDGDSVAGANVRTGASGPRLACECGPERRVHFEAACRTSDRAGDGVDGDMDGLFTGYGVARV